MSRRYNCVLALIGLVLTAACSPSNPGGPAGGSEMRGKYLVENIGMCGDCHTPRNDRGELDRTRWLQGSTLDFRPVHPPADWNDKAPGIAGLPRIGDAAVIKLLETGAKPDGKPTRPPMPQYRLSSQDAAAVADYLKTLPAGPK